MDSLASDPTVLSKKIKLGTTTFNIVGVAPPEFFGTRVGEAPEVWVPMSMMKSIPPGLNGYKDDFSQSMHLIGRLKPGVSPEQATANVNLLYQQIDVSISTRLLLFTFAAAVATAVIFGIVPALRGTQVELTDALKDGSGSSSGGTSRNTLGKALIIAQVAVSLVLMVGAILFVRSLVNLTRVDTGFNREGALRLEIDSNVTGLPAHDPRMIAMFQEIERCVSALPGVKAASFASFVRAQGSWNTSVNVPGMTINEKIDVKHNTISHAVQQVIHSVNHDLPISGVTTLDEQISRTITNQRVVAQLSAFFGLLAVFLSCIGIYGLMSYTVSRRTNEIGIRIAIGATRANVRWLVMREIVMLVAIGIVAGVPATLAGSHVVANLLFGLRGTDTDTLLGSVVVLMLVSIVAGYLPAHRAAQIDPMAALRCE